MKNFKLYTFDTIPFHFQANETLSSLALVWGLQSEIISTTEAKGWMENEAPAWVVSSLPSMWPSSAVWVPKSTGALRSTLAMLATDERSGPMLPSISRGSSKLLSTLR